MGLTARTAGLLLDATGAERRRRGRACGGDRGASTRTPTSTSSAATSSDNETLILLGILFGLGAVLMLGGTLTATFLALSDARPDLATLSAVGASPRTRRGVAAAYALVVGFVGALLGAAVGFIPGIAISLPADLGHSCPRATWTRPGTRCPSHFLDVPWLMVLGLVVVLPLLTALIVGLTARSRLPLVARLD